MDRHLKTGKALRRHFPETAEDWFTLVTMKSAAALRLIEFCERTRLTPEALVEGIPLARKLTNSG